MRLPMSLPAPGIFSTASANFLGMKWVYASTRIDNSPADLREAARRRQRCCDDDGGFRAEGACNAGGCQAPLPVGEVDGGRSETAGEGPSDHGKCENPSPAPPFPLP